MRTIKLRSKLSLLFIALATMIAIPAMALADDFRNDLDSSFDANFEVVSLGTGDAAKTVNIVLQTQGSDGDNGCNLDGTEKV